MLKLCFLQPDRWLFNNLDCTVRKYGLKVCLERSLYRGVGVKILRCQTMRLSKVRC